MYAWIHSDRKLLLTYWLYLNMCIYIYGLISYHHMNHILSPNSYGAISP